MLVSSKNKYVFSFNDKSIFSILLFYFKCFSIVRENKSNDLDISATFLNWSSIL